MLMPEPSAHRLALRPIRIHDLLGAVRDDGPSPAAELRASLREQPPRISPKFLYDPTGCRWYEQICELPEYYLPRVERQILDRHQAALLARLPRDAQLVDLGCGDGLKAHRWLASGHISRYVGVDIARDWLRDTLERSRDRFPHLSFDGVVTDFTRSMRLPTVTSDPRARIYWYPGSSIGNFEPEQVLRLFRQIREQMQAGDRFVLGADAPVEPARMRRAYDDAAGVTAGFNLNVLTVVNRLLGADFDPAAFRHRAVWDDDQHRIEMHLVARRDQRIDLGDGGEPLALGEGAAIVTEHSYKHPPERLRGWLAEAGFGHVDRFGIPGEAYGVYIAAVEAAA